jgi:hypothetical protein
LEKRSDPLNHFHRAQLAALACLFFAFSLGEVAAQDKPNAVKPVDFNRQIKPILSDRCYLCHGPDEGTREADLRFDDEEEASAAIESGEPDDSELIARIFSTDDDQMPPADSNLSLNEEEKELMKRWIAEGAVWEQHWSFVAPEKATPPKVQNKKWPANEIDQFVLHQLEANKLTPADSATREKLVRRVSFDLTGLPPTLDELDAALADKTDGWYEKVVDRLLQSPRYGERMTADWLDVARYSDTYGYQVDRDRFVWPWRDWVVRSFNQNTPYDQFITEQLAGDLLPNPTDDQILATTFNRLHPQKVEGGSVEEEFRVEYVADRSQTVGMAFMGLTVECARCHDHKYDPISQKEYYELFAFFNNIDEAGLYSYFDPEAIPTPSLLLTDDAQKQTRSDLENEVAKLEAKINARYIDRLIKSQINRGRKMDKKLDEQAMRKWIGGVVQRRELATLPEATFVADFEKTTNGLNELVEGPQKTKALKLTGDDEIKLETGAFERHQPFSIATRIKIPSDPELLKRSVVFHRSRAWTDSASRGYELLIVNGRLSASLIHFWPGNAISVRTSDTVSRDKWLHVAMTYDGSSKASGIQIFVDGEKVPVEIVRDNLQKSIIGKQADHLILGARFRDIGLKGGQLADFQVFDRQLSNLEIAGLNKLREMKKTLTLPADSLSANKQRQLFGFYLATQDEEYDQLRTELMQKRKALNEFIDGLDEIMVMQELPEARPAFVLDRGAYDAPSAPVVAATPKVFPPLAEDSPKNRLGLAQWLADPKHPLTARVAVNHYWQLCFGEGLVRTPEDFGSQGQPPTHPELLDWLSVDFQENGWDVKRLLKQIVLSKTYQQSTEASADLLKLDPDNLLLARAPTHRLPAEMLRDNVLFSSGLLVEKQGGAPVRPYELERSFQPSTPDTGEGLYRRSLYTYWKRTGPAPVMLTLDAAKRDVCQVKRERTSSPLAALVQLNNPQTVEASRALAAKLISEHGNDAAKLASDLFRTLTSRVPSDKELSIVKTLFDSQLKYFEENEKATESFIGVGESKTESESPASLAAWASVANTLFSFDECVMKR